MATIKETRPVYLGKKTVGPGSGGGGGGGMTPEEVQTMIDASIAASVGQINAVLDQINGVVI